MKRRPMKKSLRFEVFKRDSFTCQYCGAQAPDVILHVDHINPVAGGGDDDILNLVTSCQECNSGKGAKSLSDNSVLAKQKQQLNELSSRREQLQMMRDWCKAISDIDEMQIDAFNDAFRQATGCVINDHGRSKVKGWLKRHSLATILGGLDGAVTTYFKGGDEDTQKANELAGEVFKMTPRVISAQTRYADKPHMKDLFYVRAIVRNRMHCNEHVAIDLLERAYQLGAHIDELKDWAVRAKNWTNWRNEMTAWIDELEGSK